MKIRFLVPVQNVYGSFKRGEVVDWPEEDARPLVELTEPAAEKVTDKEAAQVAAETDKEKP